MLPLVKYVVLGYSKSNSLEHLLFPQLTMIHAAESSIVHQYRFPDRRRCRVLAESKDKNLPSLCPPIHMPINMPVDFAKRTRSAM